MAYTGAYTSSDFGDIIFDIIGGVGAGMASEGFLYGTLVILLLIVGAIVVLIAKGKMLIR